MEKLEMLEQFKKLYGNIINPELLSFKFCQTATRALVETTLAGYPIPFINDLKAFGELITDEDGNDKDIIPLFNPDADIIDNAQKLIELDEYSLLMFLEFLFTPAGIEEICKRQQS